MSDLFYTYAELEKLGPIGGSLWLYGWMKIQSAVELALTRDGRIYLRLSDDDFADWMSEQFEHEWREEAAAIMSGQKVAPADGYRDGFAPPLSNDPEEDYREAPSGGWLTTLMQMDEEQ